VSKVGMKSKAAPTSDSTSPDAQKQQGVARLSKGIRKSAPEKTPLSKRREELRKGAEQGSCE